MKYKIEVVTISPGYKIYWVMCGAYAVGKFYSLEDAEQWIIDNPDWDCSNCSNC